MLKRLVDNKINQLYKEIIEEGICYCCKEYSGKIIEINDVKLCRACAAKHFKWSSKILDSLKRCY